VTPSGWDCYEFMVSEDLIRQTDMIDPAFFEETTQIERAFLPAVESVARPFVQQLEWFFQAARGANGSRGAPIPQGLFRDFVLDGLQQVFDADLQARGTHTPRPRRSELHRGQILLLAVDGAWKIREIEVAPPSFSRVPPRRAELRSAGGPLSGRRRSPGGRS
jgi:hypothetical protein